MPLLSSLERRSLIERSLFSLLANLSQLARRVRVPQVEVKEFPEARVDVVEHLVADVAEAVVVEVVVDVLVVV